MLRKCGSAVVAVAMLLSSTAAAFAGTEGQQKQQGALAPGAAAGVQQAQMFEGPTVWLWLLGVGIVAGGIALAASGNGAGTPSTTTNGNP